MTDFDALIEELEEDIYTKIEAISLRAWKEVILPFCRKHQFTLSISPWTTTFAREWDGLEIEACELGMRPSVVDPGEAALVQQVLKLECMRVEMFDFQSGRDVTKKHLGAAEELAT